MLQPKKQKYRREQRNRGSYDGVSQKGNTLSFGTFGLKAMSTKEVTSRQIESARKVLSRYTKRGGKTWITIFPHKPITKKAQEVPMGGGKGSPEFFVFIVKPGRIMFEMDGIPEAEAKEALLKAGHKLPVLCKYVSKTNK